MFVCQQFFVHNVVILFFIIEKADLDKLIILSLVVNFLVKTSLLIYFLQIKIVLSIMIHFKFVCMSAVFVKV